jgi:hypothetical protein
MRSVITLGIIYYYIWSLCLSMTPIGFWQQLIQVIAITFVGVITGVSLLFLVPLLILLWGE